jgi:hypothetical protein
VGLFTTTTSDTLPSAHANPELAESAGIALAFAYSDAIRAELAPPFKGLARREAVVGLSTWMYAQSNSIIYTTNQTQY